jgi:hypothetical protein
LKESCEIEGTDTGVREQKCDSNAPFITLSEALKEVLAVEDDERGPCIGQIVDTVEDKGFGILFLVLSLPSALPVPAPGYSTPFGIAIVILAMQMLWGRHILWIPQRLRRIRLKKKTADSLVERGTITIRWLERFIKPRHQWVSSTLGLRALSIVIICMGALMILPIPFTNTAPAMVIFFIGLGLAEDDGVLAVGAFALGCLAVALYACIIYLFCAHGPEAVTGLEEMVKGFIR